MPHPTHAEEMVHRSRIHASGVDWPTMDPEEARKAVAEVLADMGPDVKRALAELPRGGTNVDRAVAQLTWLLQRHGFAVFSRRPRAPLAAYAFALVREIIAPVVPGGRAATGRVFGQVSDWSRGRFGFNEHWFAMRSLEFAFRAAGAS